MVLNYADTRVIIVTHILVDALLGHLHQYDIRHTVPNLEAAKFKLGPVVGEFAEESIRRQHECLDVFSCTGGGIGMCLRFRVFILLSYVKVF